jgi:hypothetical protein
MKVTVVLTALAEAAAMLIVAGGYVAVSRGRSALRHPLSIFLYVLLVGVLVAVLGELYTGGWSGVPAMVRRAVIGSAGWGVVIAGGAWGFQRLVARWRT